ncbi:MAG: hypothetical protein RSA24_00300 [Clostridia bacterium]
MVVDTIKALGGNGLVQKNVQLRPDGGNASNEYLVLNDKKLVDWLGVSDET